MENDKWKMDDGRWKSQMRNVNEKCQKDCPCRLLYAVWHLPRGSFALFPVNQFPLIRRFPFSLFPCYPIALGDVPLCVIKHGLSNSNPETL